MADAVCEKCGCKPAKDFVPDRVSGWNLPRRLCGQCAAVVLDQRRKEQR